jgi:heavy metal efflux system protein
VVAAIVVMNRTLHTNDVVPLIKAEVEKINHDGSLPPGVKLAPFYDRTDLVAVTTHTVLHNLIFGCLLVFFIQWVFLGDLRSAIIVSVNIPFALFFSIIVLVRRGEDANLLSIGAVDFGIIVDSAVILVENIFRNLQMNPAARGRLLEHLAEGAFGTDPTRPDGSVQPQTWTTRLRLILINALEVDKAIFFSTAITVAAFVPLFTMQGVEGQIFNPMARTYGYSLAGALIATFTITPVLTSYFLPKDIKETETIIVRTLHRLYTPALRWSLRTRPETAKRLSRSPPRRLAARRSTPPGYQASRPHGTTRKPPLWLDQSARRRLDRGMHPAGRIQLQPGVVDMEIHRALRQAQDRCDLRRCLASRRPG